VLESARRLCLEGDLYFVKLPEAAKRMELHQKGKTVSQLIDFLKQNTVKWRKKRKQNSQSPQE